MDPRDQSGDSLSILDFASFTSSSFTFVICLLNRVLAKLTSHGHHGLYNLWIVVEFPLTKQIVQGENMMMLLTQNANALCQCWRVSSSSIEKSIILGILSQGPSTSVPCTWTLSPRQPWEGLTNFQNFSNLFHYICSVVHHDMVINPPWIWMS